MYKVVRIGTVKPWEGGRWCSIHCAIRFESGKLSISGVIGATASGNAIGGAGQIDSRFAHRNSAHDDRRTRDLIKPGQIRFAPGWSSKSWLTFLEFWHDYHLNDMSPACEHQRFLPEFQHRELTLHTATLDWNGHYRLIKDAESQVKAQYGDRTAFHENNQVAFPVWKQEGAPDVPAGVSLATGFKFSPAIAILKPLFDLGLRPFSKVYLSKGQLHRQAQKYRRYMPPGFSYDGLIKWGTETKLNHGVSYNEHPAGLLSRPCPVCNYKYGTQWFKRQVPTEVIEWLFALPAADQPCPWRSL